MRQSIRKILILISFLLFPITLYYFSPYLIYESTAFNIMDGSFIVFILLFAGALIFGRAWCGWLCAGAGLMEACFSINNKKVNNNYNWIRYIFWVPWISGILILILAVGGYKKIDPFFMTFHGISVIDLGSYLIYYAIIILIIAPSFIWGKRAFCHYICWMSPFVILARMLRNLFNWPSLQLVVDKNKCNNCLLCGKNCPMSLNVNEMVLKTDMENYECILCGSCVDICPQKAIKYAFGSKSGS